MNSCDSNQIIRYENTIGSLFIALGCKQNNLRKKALAGVTTDSDGSFPDITVNSAPGVASQIKPEILTYVRILSEIMGINIHIPDTYILHQAQTANRARPENIIDRDDLFSYAFVAGPNSNSCFSYTLGMR